MTGFRSYAVIEQAPSGGRLQLLFGYRRQFDDRARVKSGG